MAKKTLLEEHPIDTVRHDILLIADDDRYYRFPVNKTAPSSLPLYTEEPVTPGLTDPGTRKIRNLAEQGDGKEFGPPRGPVFATLPLNPEPASSSSLTCYLINTKNLEYRNPWTTQEWSQANAKTKFVEPDCEFRLLVAAPDGKIYLMEKECGLGVMPTVRLADPDNVEVWAQLRNGTVVGRVLYADSRSPEGVVPLVNVTSLLPGDESEAKS